MKLTSNLVRMFSASLRDIFALFFVPVGVKHWVFILIVTKKVKRNVISYILCLMYPF